MRNLLMTILVICAINLFAQDYIADEIYVKLKSKKLINTNRNDDKIDLNEFKSVLQIKTKQKSNLQEVRASFYFSKSKELQKIFRVKIPSSSNIKALLDVLNRDPNVEYAERIPLMRKSLTPNDLGSNSFFGQWALHKIQAPNAWDINTGDPSIVIAVVDDAIDTGHLDLNRNCLQGRDVADNDNDPRPISQCHSHGTHVAGIVGAATNNFKGVASIGYNVSILPVKATYDSDNSCRYIYTGYEGITWAAENGADIINLSWGGEGFSNSDEQVINNALAMGVIIIAAAGNKDSTTPQYPAAYNNVISVAATDIDDRKYYDNDTTGTNYGTWIDVAAPGVHIRSTVPFNNYLFFTGTSMASPMVAGLCGLVWSADLSQTPESVIDCVLNTTDNIDFENPLYVGLLGTGRINAYKALLCASPPPPSTNCISEITFTYPFYNFIHQKTSNWIEGRTNNIIQPGANVTYDAGNQVRLKPGFKALQGSRFHAFIDGCGGNRKLSNTEITAVEDEFELSIYPNPFNQLASISYTLAKNDQLTIDIFDATGKRITTLVKNQKQSAGQHQMELAVGGLPTGIYYLKLQSNENNIIKQLMITK